MVGLALSVPAKRASAWFAETDPKAARAWLASLPLADSAEAAREIYQTLYTLNRQDIEVRDRLAIMELYRDPVATASSALQSHFAHTAHPLTPKKRQLAEFIRQLHMEMAYGYKYCLNDFRKSWIRWNKKHTETLAMERAMRYLGEVLLRSYQVYMPYPATVWKEIHELYRYAEANERHLDPVNSSADAAGANEKTITERYLQILLLGLSNPYQLPQNDCNQINLFLEKWAGKAELRHEFDRAKPVGHFLVDLTADSPPVPFPRDSRPTVDPTLRVLSAMRLVRTVQSFINRIQNGESAQSLQLGVDCLDSACLDLLRRMVRSWGLIARRRHSRVRRNSHIFVCTGLNAVHFFCSGQKPFAAPELETEEAKDKQVTLPSGMNHDLEGDEEQKDEAYIPLDEPGEGAVAENKETHARPMNGTFRPAEIYRVDRWHVMDVGPQGMFLARYGESGTYVRVGDLLGLQRAEDPGRWSVAVARWIKSPETNSLEMGIELLAPDVKPVAVKPAVGKGAAGDRYTQGLLLPAVAASRRPATLLVMCGTCRLGYGLHVMEDDAPPRLVRSLEVLERSGSFEQVVFADVLNE